ncbi:MAG: hypothetical protein ACYSTL_07440 [Planctomycetota bacterium]|jgi:hypothetical protein
MLSQYSTKVKVRIGLGILALIVGAVLIPFPADAGGNAAWGLIVSGLALCTWGGISHAIDRGYRAPGWLRWLLVLPVALGVYAAIFVFLRSATSLVSDLAAICFAPRLDSVAADYPFIAVRLVLTSAAGSYYMVLAGAKTAPKYRFMSGMMLAILSLCGSAYVLASLSFWYNFGAWSDIWTSRVLWVYVPWTCGFVAAILACVQVRRHEVRLQKAEPSQGEQEL